MHHDPGARLPAFVAWRVRHIGTNETLLALVNPHALLEIIAVIDGAFAFEHVSDRLDPLVIMRLGDGTGRHRQDVHADLLRADSFGGCAGTIGETLLAHIGLARLNHRYTVMGRSRHSVSSVLSRRSPIIARARCHRYFRPPQMLTNNCGRR